MNKNSLFPIQFQFYVYNFMHDYDYVCDIAP